MKAFWKSKVLWTNALTLGLHFARPAIASTLGVDVQSTPDVSPSVLAVANIVLRAVTSQALTAK